VTDTPYSDHPILNLWERLWLCPQHTNETPGFELFHCFMSFRLYLGYLAVVAVTPSVTGITVLSPIPYSYSSPTTLTATLALSHVTWDHVWEIVLKFMLSALWYPCLSSSKLVYARLRSSTLAYLA
jgi:hypothetical protein